MYNLEKPGTTGDEPSKNRVVGAMVAGLVFLIIIIGVAFWDVVQKATTEANKDVVASPSPTPSPTAAPAEESDPRGCLEGKVGTIIDLHTEKTVLNSDSRDWTWETTVVFDLGDDLVVTCAFDGYKLDEVWKPGMKMKGKAGERVVGEYTTKPE